MVGMVVTHAKLMMSTLNKTAKIAPPDRENTWPNVQELCKKINPQTLVGGLYVADAGGFATHTVWTVIVDHMQRTRTGVEQILSFSSYLASDLIDLLTAIETGAHFRTYLEQVTIVKQTGGAIGGEDLSVSAPGMYNYLELIRKIEEYGHEFLSMDPRADS